jgi:hypothetical protein
VAVQQALIDLGYDLGPTGADGIYGDLTWNAVKQFKAGQNLGWGWMGDVGPGTMGRLDELYSGEQGLPPCPEILPFEENTSPNIYVPGKTCQIGGKPPISAKPTADLRFMQEIPPTAGTSVKDNSPEIFCQARFEANVKGSGRGGKIAFLQNIIRSYGIKLGNGHPYNCTLPIGVDHDKYYGIMEPEEESGWIDVPESGSWDRSFKTWDRPSLGSEVDCLPAGAHIDLYRHDKFRMFIFWEPEDDHLVPLAHSDWEWSLLAGFDKMQDGKWITQPWDLHGNYMTPSQEGISPSNQRIITSPVHRTGSCPDTTCGMPEVSADKFASKLVPDRKPEGMKITSSSNLSNKIQNNETPDVLNTTNNKNAIYLQSEDFAVSSFHGGGSACGLACPEPKPRPIIGRGSVGGPIPELQEKLNSWADNSGLEVPYAPLKVDGNFGGKTESAVKFFQSKHLGQTKYVDGVVGQLTWPAIDDEASGLYGLPYGETVESNGWRTGEEATIHRWRHKLDPAETNFYCGWVTEAELGVDDECYKSSFPHLVPERHLTGGTWCVHSSNWWGDDDLGLIVSAVETYRKTSKKLPCTITFWQSMRMQQESEDIEYAVHEMKYIIDKENVTSKKDDVECTRKWP